MIENPQDCIGKFIAYDCDNGAVWAFIENVIEMNTINGKKSAFIVKGMAVRNKNNVLIYEDRRVVHLEKISNLDIVSSSEISDPDPELFLKILAADANGFTSLSLAEGMKNNKGQKSYRIKTNDENENIFQFPFIGR